MDVTILNTDLDAVAIVDTYESFIWTDRYYAYGDFELVFLIISNRTTICRARNLSM